MRMTKAARANLFEEIKNKAATLGYKAGCGWRFGVFEEIAPTQGHLYVSIWDRDRDEKVFEGDGNTAWCFLDNAIYGANSRER